MRRLLRLLAQLLLLVIVALASTLVSMRFAIHGREVAIPDFRGMSSSEAERAAYSRGLEVAWSERFYSSSVPAGDIVSQQPDPGTRVRHGWLVQLSRSLGPQLIDVPSLLGKSRRAAEVDIRRRGLEVGSSAQLPILSSSTAVTVLAQCPAGGAEGIASPRIGLLYSAPLPEAAYAMPDLTGMTLADAAKLITVSGFKIASVTSAAPGGAGASHAANATGGAKPRAAALSAALAGRSADESTVVAQSPPAGSRVTPSTDLSLEVVRSL